MRFSRIATCPLFRHPKAATARLILPSPLKSAASMLATRGQPSSQNAPNFPFARPRIQMTAPLGVIGGKELPHLGHEQILDAVLVDVRHRDVGRVRDAGDLSQGGRGRARSAAEDQPLTHVRAQQIELPVSVEIDQPHVRDRGSAGHSGNREHATCEGDR